MDHYTGIKYRLTNCLIKAAKNKNGHLTIPETSTLLLDFRKQPQNIEMKKEMFFSVAKMYFEMHNTGMTLKPQFK